MPPISRSSAWWMWTADHTFDTAATSLVGHGIGKRRDVLHGILDPLLEIGRQRPVRISEPAPRGVEIPIEPKSGGVGAVAEQCKPAGVHDNDVERIAHESPTGGARPR